MLVYVIKTNGQPLMPTSRCGKTKHLLNSGMAKVVKRCPFTIQLDGTKVSANASYKKIRQLEKRKTMLTERRMQGMIAI